MHETKELVINTGPILALIAAVGDLSLLDVLYKRVLVSLEVAQEIEAGGTKGFGIIEFKKSNFLEKCTNPLTISPFLRNALDLGEASVIQLALNENIQTVCIDESMGRRVARLNDLKLTGSIGVLIRAKQNGFDFLMQDAIQRMQAQGIYLSQKVINFALEQVDEI